MTSKARDSASDDRPTLDELGARFKTDKSSLAHNYLVFYEQYFKPARDAALKILEIGVLGGASLRTWHAYFPNAQIVGVDVSPFARSLRGDRIVIELADQSNIEEMTQLGVDHGPFDIVIEDGSHNWSDQVASLQLLFPFVRNGGLYIVEDLQTNYQPSAERFRRDAAFSCMDYLKSLLDLHVGEQDRHVAKNDLFLRTYSDSIEFLSFARGVCVIKKHYRRVDRGLLDGLLLPSRRTSFDTVPVELLGHVANVGDIVSPEGHIHSGAQSVAIQGISLRCPPPFAGSLEYRTRDDCGRWTQWCIEGEYAGTRGQQRSITGYSIRAASDAAAHFSLDYVGLFAGDPEPRRCRNGDDCISSLERPLYALQVELTASERNSEATARD